MNMPRRLEARSTRYRLQARERDQIRPEKSQPRSPWRSLMNTAQFAVGLGAYLAVLGFIVNLGLLKQSTTLIPFKVVPLTYVALGISYLLDFLIVAGTIAIAIIISSYILVLIIWAVRDKVFSPVKAFKFTLQTWWEVIALDKLFIVYMIIFLLLTAVNPVSLLRWMPHVEPNPSKQNGVTLVFKEPMDTSICPIP